MTCPKGWTFLRAHSVNGLICALAPRHLQIWNPTTRRFTSSLKNLWTDSVSFLGYDPIGGTYKVLSLPAYPSHADNQPRAQTLGGAQESWRVVQGLTDHAPFRRSGQQCINGVLYYLASPDLSVCNQFLVRFHVRSEKLTRIDVPWTRCCLLMASEGKLVSVLSLGDDITMWTLEEDAEKAEWSCIRRKLPFPSYDPVSETWLELMGINDAGEFIYVQSAVEKEIPFHILYFMQRGTASEESWLKELLMTNLGAGMDSETNLWISHRESLVFLLI
uniref:Putative F-box protein n=1 Tax=Noccaea caerulescens TaxID=107243 RepID=A0A1J3JN37_NOCCA